MVKPEVGRLHSAKYTQIYLKNYNLIKKCCSLNYLFLSLLSKVRLGCFSSFEPVTSGPVIDEKDHRAQENSSLGLDKLAFVRVCMIRRLNTKTTYFTRIKKTAVYICTVFVKKKTKTNS